MKFKGTASTLIKRFADSVSPDIPGLRGLRYQASRLQGANADDLFDLRFEDGEWTVEYLRDLDQDDAKAASALMRYAEARLAALEETIYRFATGPITVSQAAILLDAVPDSIRARILDGSLEGYVENGRATTSFPALVRFLDERVRVNQPQALQPVIDR